ncbi:MAG: hypothetical protein DHS20C16_03330 [Phycisphaerae bacterium]|nr:MAG: hypothetical protein DHS20C16_03330 [Phycisphaerae bacterium]
MNKQRNVWRIALEVAGYQVAWWSCVLSVRAGAMWIGLAATATIFLIHMAYSPSRRAEIWSVPAAAGLGFAADNVATWLGALHFESTHHWVLPAPLWIAAMWLAFAMLIWPCFSWLAGRPLAAAFMGATSGPTAYGAGVALNIVEMPDLIWSIAVLAVLWAIVVPLAIMLVVSAAANSTNSQVAAGTYARNMA